MRPTVTMGMDVIRKILDQIREHDGGVMGFDAKLDDVPPAVVVHHLPLLVDAGWSTPRAAGDGRARRRLVCGPLTDRAAQLHGAATAIRSSPHITAPGSTFPKPTAR